MYITLPLAARSEHGLLDPESAVNLDGLLRTVLSLESGPQFLFEVGIHWLHRHHSSDLLRLQRPRALKPLDAECGVALPVGGNNRIWYRITWQRMRSFSNGPKSLCDLSIKYLPIGWKMGPEPPSRISTVFASGRVQMGPDGVESPTQNNKFWHRMRLVHWST